MAPAGDSPIAVSGWLSVVGWLGGWYTTEHWGDTLVSNVTGTGASYMMGRASVVVPIP